MTPTIEVIRLLTPVPMGLGSMVHNWFTALGLLILQLFEGKKVRVTGTHECLRKTSVPMALG